MRTHTTNTQLLGTAATKHLLIWLAGFLSGLHLEKYLHLELCKTSVFPGCHSAMDSPGTANPRNYFYCPETRNANILQEICVLQWQMCICAGASAPWFVTAASSTASTPEQGQAQKAKPDYVWLQVNALPEVSQLKTEEYADLFRDKSGR